MARPEIWAFGLGTLFVALLLAAWVIPVHGAPALKTAFREDYTVDAQLQLFRQRNLREYVDAARRDYDRLTGGVDEAWYHEALAAEMQTRQVLKMIERALPVVEARPEKWLKPLHAELAVLRAHYAGLLRELQVHRETVLPKTPGEPMELIPTPPAQIPRYDGY